MRNCNFFLSLRYPNRPAIRLSHESFKRKASELTQGFTKIIEYSVKPEASEANALRAAELTMALESKRPDGFSYIALDLGNGRFLHIANARTEAAKDVIYGLPEFKAWAEPLNEICAEGLNFTDATEMWTAATADLPIDITYEKEA